MTSAMSCSVAVNTSPVAVTPPADVRWSTASLIIQSIIRRDIVVAGDHTESGAPDDLAGNVVHGRDVQQVHRGSIQVGQLPSVIEHGVLVRRQVDRGEDLLVHRLPFDSNTSSADGVVPSS